MQYTEIVLVVKNLKFHQNFSDIFAQNIDGEAVLTSTHNLCFGAKIRKIGILLHTPLKLYKRGVRGEGGRIHFTDMFSRCILIPLSPWLVLDNLILDLKFIGWNFNGSKLCL